MTDARARELERRFRESGTIDDEAAWLSARLRAGEVTVDALMFDAYLGRPAAQLALGEPVTPLVVEGHDAGVLWLRGFAAWGEDVLLRAGLARRFASAAPRRASSPEVDAALTAVDRWCRSPVDALPTELEEETDDDDVWALGQLVADRRDRRGILQAIERGGLELSLVRVDVAAMAPLLATWVVAPTLVVPLEEDGSLRERVERAVTPTRRRELVRALRGRHGQTVRLRLRGAVEERRLDFHGVTYESVAGILDRASPMLELPLDDIAELLP